MSRLVGLSYVMPADGSSTISAAIVVMVHSRRMIIKSIGGSVEFEGCADFGLRKPCAGGG